MANIVAQYDISNINDQKEFMRYASIVVGQIIDAINGKLDFSNLKTQQVSVTFNGANTNQSISHNLGKTGVSYIVASKSATCDIYSGSGDTSSTINLKSTVGGVTVSLLLF